MTAPLQTLESPDGLAGQSWGAAHGSAIGGPEIWNVAAWGDVRECRDIATIMEEVREALNLGCRTISIERQGAPSADIIDLPT